MIIQIIHGVQKYNLDLPESSSTSGQQQEVNTDVVGNDEKNPEGQPNQENTDWTIRKLKEEIEKLTGVPVDGQRLIKKGKTLFGDDTPLATLKFIPGEKIMVLGHKPEFSEDPCMKSLVTVERTILEGIENKMKEVDERLQGIQQGYLTKDLVNPALNELGKQLKILAEDCMKTLELMDAMRLSEDTNDRARSKRKLLVLRVQSILRWHDELMERLEQVSSEVNPKQQRTF